MKKLEKKNYPLDKIKSKLNMKKIEGENCMLHKIPEGFVITSDETPKGSDLIMWTGNTVEHFPKQGTPEINYGCIVESVNYSGTIHKDWRKVIAQQNQIDFSSLSEEEQKKIEWFDVEELAINLYNSEVRTYKFNANRFDEQSIIDVMCKMFQKGQELLSDRVFTLEHIRKAIKYGSDFAFSCTHSSDYMTKEELKNAEQSEEQFIQSLSQPKSWKIEIEIEEYVQEETGTELKWVDLRPKFTDGKIKITKIL